VFSQWADDQTFVVPCRGDDARRTRDHYKQHVAQVSQRYIAQVHQNHEAALRQAQQMRAGFENTARLVARRDPDQSVRERVYTGRQVAWLAR